jgi:hypothetical protein
MLIGRDMGKLNACIEQILSGKWKEKQEIPLWDGHTADRISEAIMDWSVRS